VGLRHSVVLQQHILSGREVSLLPAATDSRKKLAGSSTSRSRDVTLNQLSCVGSKRAGNTGRILFKAMDIEFTTWSSHLFSSFRRRLQHTWHLPATTINKLLRQLCCLVESRYIQRYLPTSQPPNCMPLRYCIRAM
jgi:hypothetical protein